MSTRDLTPLVKDELEKGLVRLAMFVECIFDDGPLRLWSGLGPYTFNGQIYEGAGSLGGIDAIEENAGDVKATGVAMKLSGIPSDMVALCLAEHFQGRPVTIWFAMFDENGALIPDAIQIFKGRMDYPVIEEGGETATITVFAESLLIDLERPRIRRYTNEDQTSAFPGDMGLEFTAAIQNVEIVWQSKA